MQSSCCSVVPACLCALPWDKREMYSPSNDEQTQKSDLRSLFRGITCGVQHPCAVVPSAVIEEREG